jgi:5-methylcytosine-specific restriction endonuclease McrA
MRQRYQDNPETFKARKRANYLANPEAAKAAAREAYHADRAAALARSKAWSLANPERHAELRQRWRDANRARIKAYNSTYYAENRESEIARCLAYIKAHPEVDAAIKQRRNARKRDVVCEHGLTCVTATFLKAIRAADCLYCAAPGGKGHADHFIPLSRGGLHCVENIVPACVRCNTSKHAMDPHDWLAGLKRSA